MEDKCAGCMYCSKYTKCFSLFCTKYMRCNILFGKNFRFVRMIREQTLKTAL